MSGFDEVIDGILHWQAPHPRIGQDVHSYYLPFQRLVIDPIVVEGVIDDLAVQGGVERVVLTNRHHLRGSEQLAEAFRCSIHAPEPGMDEFSSEQPVQAYRWGDELAAGVVAHEMAAICPDDGALHISVGPGAIAFADGVIGWQGGLAFVPDFLMDDPEQVKRAQLEAMRRLLALEFEAVLLAHGPPVPSGGKELIERFIDAPTQADFSA
jgi:glyoxylase-like metal-dependent hydrolase (beta-lactamase superfamily II)